jgi:HEPN domain-containing protein
LRELRARKDPNYDDGCFHAQQCIEKYLKALLQENGIPFPKTHQLEKLVDLMSPDPAWLTIRARLVPLNSYAVNFRYPGHSADKPKLKGRDGSLCRGTRSLPASPGFVEGTS